MKKGNRSSYQLLLVVVLVLLTIGFARAQTTVNVKSYGAKGDGITDDKMALDKAIRALSRGDILYFPAGRYVLGKNSNDGLKIASLSQITIKGDGPQSKIFYYFSSYNDGTSGEGRAALTLQNTNQIQITKLSFQGIAEIPSPSYSYSSETSGILIDQSENLKIEDVDVVGFSGFGIYITSQKTDRPSRNISITKSRARQNRVAGIIAANVDTLVVSESILDGNGQIGDPATGYGFAGYSKSWPGYPANVSLLNNEVSRNLRKGIDFHAGVDINIIGNSIYENGLYGIDAEGPGLGGKIIIKENHIFSMGSKAAEMLQVRNDHPVVQANYTGQICGICIFFMKKSIAQIPDKDILIQNNTLENLTQYSDAKGQGYYSVYPFGLANFDGANRDLSASFSFIGNKVINSDFSSLFLQGWTGDSRAGRYEFKFSGNMIEHSGLMQSPQIFFHDAKAVDFRDNTFIFKKKQITSLVVPRGATNEGRIKEVDYKNHEIPLAYTSTHSVEQILNSPNLIIAYSPGFIPPQFSISNNKVIKK